MEFGFVALLLLLLGEGLMFIDWPMVFKYIKNKIKTK